MPFDWSEVKPPMHVSVQTCALVKPTIMIRKTPDMLMLSTD
jgi:hypothetical protein